MNPNPCLCCPKINEDKNNTECTRCKKRIRYVRLLSSGSGCYPTKKDQSTPQLYSVDGNRSSQPFCPWR